MSATSTHEPTVTAAHPNLVTRPATNTTAAWTADLSAGTDARAVQDLALTTDGKIVVTGGADGDASSVGRLPRRRMAAGDSWEEIVQSLRTAEDGRRATADVELRPGGQLVLIGREQPPRPLSQLPRGRMAANQPPTVEDVELLRRLDPGNAEQWTPVLADELTGWAFWMTPPFPGQPRFAFLAFRSPSDGNAFRIAVLEPDMDAAHGHACHMIAIYVGGQKIPVICGPGGRPAKDLARVRTQAAKWMAYTSAWMAGRNPGFSL